VPVESFFEKIERYAFERPDKIAIQIHEHSITWRELKDQILHIGVEMDTVCGRDVPVLIPGEKSIWQYVVMLSVASTARRAVLTPTSWTEDLIDYALQGIGETFLIAGGTVDHFRFHRPRAGNSANSSLSSEEPWSEQFGFGCFTSGTTGVPKIAWAFQNELLRFAQDACQSLDLCQNDVFSEIASGSSSLSLSNFVLSIFSGGIWTPLVGMGETARALDAFVTRRITVFRSTFGAFRAAIDLGRMQQCSALRICAFGGEPLPFSYANSVAAAAPSVRVLNTYGLTETPGWVLQYFLPAAHVSEALVEEVDTVVPLGRPMNFVRVLEPANEDSEGELVLELISCIASSSDSRNKAIVSNRIIRTGDRVKLHDGVLLYSGRTDRMFKMRGVRIQPEFWEMLIYSKLGCRSVLLPNLDGSLMLVVESKCGSNDSLVNTVLQAIPTDIFPRSVIVVSALSELPSGKIDFRRVTQEFATR
jgi:acyl-coenzyme A synthetase/AMP-(fatty) acid ligase